jgi:[Skp1-protein]-hydroxyproline N-acetylglucosaminyltransferase
MYIILLCVVFLFVIRCYQQDTIFVSIASYRDNACLTTVDSIFRNAAYPKRIFVGICQQNSKNEHDVRNAQTFSTYQDNISVKRMPHVDAKGPVLARYHCSKLYNGQDYYFQIDSHTTFEKNWDIVVIDMYKRINDTQAIISHYPSSKRTEGVPVLNKCLPHDKYVCVLKGEILPKTNDVNHRETMFVSGGMVFMPKQAIVDVPFDPNMPYLFQGEEILHSARLWTSGYNIYAPDKHVIYHNYDRKDAPRFWDDVPNYSKKNQHAIAKVKYILGLKGGYILHPTYKYMLGNKRTIATYFDIVHKYYS